MISCDIGVDVVGFVFVVFGDGRNYWYEIVGDFFFDEFCFYFGYFVDEVEIDGIVVIVGYEFLIDEYVVVG